jgi:hypothetical protein
MVGVLPQSISPSAAPQGVIQVIPPGALDRMEAQQNKKRAQAEDAAAHDAQVSELAATNLAGYIRGRFEMMRNHRNNTTAGWSNRLIAALRAFNGQYDASKLQEIQKFGGSQIYMRLVAAKCRGASSLLRDVYLQGDRPWGLDPGPDPAIPPEVMQNIEGLIRAEMQQMQAQGQQIDPNQVRDRLTQLLEAARQAAKNKAADSAKIAEDKIDEFLIEGRFYEALAEFLVDIAIFPFACLKGPVVRVVPGIDWSNGTAITTQKPQLFWERVSPFDIWWTPGVSDIENAETIEKQRLTRADINDLIDLPGYNRDEIYAVLDEYGRGGLSDVWDQSDAERADMENRENPLMNRSGLITCLEYNGNVQGRMLLEQGMDAKYIGDPMRDYMVQAWLIGTHVIKVQMSPSPRKRIPYFITSFEKVPGTPLGNGLTDIITDLQEATNSVARALINNLAVASGPQVMVNDDRLAPGEDGEDLYPWKRWHYVNDPTGGNQQVPISFFQPTSNVQELLSVLDKLNAMADDASAIPRYLSGQGAGGAGRTSSGLAMLMANASKVLQTVAANIDRDVFQPALTALYDMIMLTDQSGLLTGDEKVRVMGVTVAIQRETQRARQLEFLQITANPVDMAIIGPEGRATVLSAVADSIGMPGAKIVPSEDEIKQKQQAAMQMQAQQQAQQGNAAAQAQGNQAPRGGNVTGDQGPRVAIAGGPQ